MKNTIKKIAAAFSAAVMCALPMAESISANAGENNTGYGANTAAANPTTCTYNGTINLPATNPTRPGYAFNGWKLRAPQCTIPAEDMNTEPTSGSGHGWYNNADVCYNYDGWTINCSTVQDLAVNQWKVAWSNGDVVNGIASCNDTLPSNWDTLMAQQAAIEELPEEEQGAAFEAWYASAMSSLYGTNGSAIMPSNTFTSNSTGQYCWCKATHYTANNAQQCSLLSSAWVLTPEGFFEGEPEKCAKRCPDLCANLSRYSLTLFFGGSITQ